jgi:hypothetical protein
LTRMLLHKLAQVASLCQGLPHCATLCHTVPYCAILCYLVCPRKSSSPNLTAVTYIGNESFKNGNPPELQSALMMVCNCELRNMSKHHCEFATTMKTRISRLFLHASTLFYSCTKLESHATTTIFI